jgi:hypothetical protein
MTRGRYRILAGLAACAFGVGAAYAAPGDVLLQDDFDSGAGCGTLSPLWTGSDSNLTGVGTQTSNSGSCSAFTRGDVATLTGPVIDLSSVTGATLTAWLRQGLDAFSEDVDSGEDFVFEYQDSGGNWIPIETLFGAGPNGEITNVSLDLPVSALHASFRLRFRQTGGSGGPPANGGIGYDYWHIDDVLLVETGTPPPVELPSGMGVGLCERFESGFGNWTASNGSRAGINGDTFQSFSNSMFLRRNTVTATSLAFDSAGMTDIDVWVRRGADSFSENPDNGENLSFEYLDSSNNWVTLETFLGSGTPGEILERTYSVPAAALHTNFRVRFRLNTGSGSDLDYWHVDDLCFNRGDPDFLVTKSVAIVQDPINGTLNPLSIPGAWAVYSIQVTNTGRGIADAGTVAIGDMIDPNTSLFTGNFNGAGSPFVFLDGSGSNASGLSLNFGSLSDGSDGVSFVNSGGGNMTPNGDFDPSVAGFNLQFDGAMNGASGTANPTFSIQYRVQVE